MTPAVLEKIREHALADAPREACGLVVDVDGRRIVVRGKNVSEHQRHFTLSPESYNEARKAGKIVALYHSHPNEPPDPSQADVTACNRSGLPWHIYSIPADRASTLLPVPQATPLLGRVFCWGVHDCFTLARDYYRQLGIVIPEYEYEERFWEKGKDYYTERTLACGFVKVPDQNDIRPHDLLHMSVRSSVPNHGAIYVGRQMILHHLQKRLSCRDIYGPFWKFITVGVYRHPEAKGEVRYS